ncbi:hypothetical protein PU00_19265 [Hafnia alvei]|nr:hypothetical protein PU00_19265 [Hafnia alvei]
MSFYVVNREVFIMNEKISSIKPRQVRLAEMVDQRVRESAKRCHRSIQAEIAYRMELLMKLEDKGDVVIQ